MIGAGASHDCFSPDSGRANLSFEPPLVNGIFKNNDAFNAILHHYPGAESLSDHIRSQIMKETSLESLLLDIFKQL